MSGIYIFFSSVLLFMMLASIDPAVADIEICECRGSTRTVPEALSYSDAVFTGRVTSITPLSDTDYFAEFAVYDSWKNVKEEKIRVISTSSQKNCGFNFEVGGEYIVYSYIPSFISSANQKQQMSNKESMMITTTNSCNQTKLMEEITEEELKLLGTKIYSSNLRSYIPKESAS